MIAGRADLVSVKRWAILKPVRQVVRGVFLDNCSGEVFVVPRWLIQVLFAPIPVVNLTHGFHIGSNLGGGWAWDITDPRTPDALIEAMEREAFAPMRGLVTLDDHLDYCTDARTHGWGGFEWRPIYRLYAHAVSGRFDEAMPIIEKLADNARRALSPRPDYEARIQTELRPLIEANDRAGVAALLRSYEAFTVKALGLEKVWEPAPYPIELAG